ncbi:UDP-glucose/GDP-mannose dehydrogenase family protein [Azospirillum sp. RWY-5-1]|uniref:UDP-glucose 6-dehydrogenase n=1 Tax=Azospirillum oleiclasticum TaxID=2735135 RepID=A0ABX2TMS5_9PROT|nr:nucleotide sugar dehydrogenase [Azospirillum oleiclasticum]NYZ17909.1 UDP-glucose/GDP-mannose dehydrogenase family protein [Azospirillum oleiclasticum]NYZ25116.1 UDP-glucose/GDP-mannose dehydrogenase family protein [Azospirillum oleiclasticum]
MRICVVGLGKLGSPLAAVLASKGHDVIGIDLNPTFVDAINAGIAPVEEPGLQAMISANRERLSATTDWATAMKDAEATFMIVPTPSGSDGTFVNTFVLQAIERLGAELRRHDRYHLVVVSSTVMPGSTGGPIREALEAASGRTLGDRLGLCYNPEFIALGNVLHGLLCPDFVLIGESDARAGAMLEELYKGVCHPAASIARMNFVNAELTKISLNTYVTTKISFANMLAEICDRLPGADVDVVTDAIGRDTRVGRKYLRGALGFAGPCFPRDTIAFSRMARTVGIAADIAEATDAINLRQIDRLFRIVSAGAGPGDGVVVLGLAYKPDTPVIEQSQSVALVQRLVKAGHRVTVYDPAAMPPVRAMMGDSIAYADGVEDAVKGAAVVVVATAWDEFRALSPQALEPADGGRPVVVDCWRILPRDAFADVADILYLGRNTDQGSAHRTPARALEMAD